MSNQLPEDTRKKRKHLQELLQKYTDGNIETKLKGDKLIFTQTGNISWDNVGPLPAADEVISNKPVIMSISIGNTVDDNGNRFASYNLEVLSSDYVTLLFAIHYSTCNCIRNIPMNVP